MRITVKCAVLIITLSLTSCFEINNVHEESVNAYEPTLVLIGIDISGTFKGYEKLPPQYLANICTTIAEVGEGGLVALYPIGNPNDSSFLRCKILPQEAVDEKAILSIQAQQVKDIKRIKTINQKEVASFIDRYQQSIYLRGNQQETDIQRFLQNAIDLCNESTFDGYEKYVFIYSDGLQDVGGNTNLVLPTKDEIEGIQFYGCGIRNPTLTKHLNIKKLESPKGFIESFTNHLSKKVKK